MGELVSVFMDVVLAGLLITGIVYAMRLSRQMTALRSGRAEMERFVADFSATVQRAEVGIRGLKQASREGGDDLEKLIDKANSIREELQFLVESADHIANRISDTASAAARNMLADTPSPEPKLSMAAAQAAMAALAETKAAAAKSSASSQSPAAQTRLSAAERELLSALEKVG